MMVSCFMLQVIYHFLGFFGIVGINGNMPEGAIGLLNPNYVASHNSLSNNPTCNYIGQVARRI